mmetsp:Transcript_24467/g.77327  ORF Transcript_24467/g.77327 Transcript_24467/m.77327 type:complete len:222 (-) Transcript_24467:1244-1909(-)
MRWTFWGTLPPRTRRSSGKPSSRWCSRRTSPSTSTCSLISSKSSPIPKRPSRPERCSPHAHPAPCYCSRWRSRRRTSVIAPFPSSSTACGCSGCRRNFSFRGTSRRGRDFRFLPLWTETSPGRSMAPTSSGSSTSSSSPFTPSWPPPSLSSRDFSMEPAASARIGQRRTKSPPPPRATPPARIYPSPRRARPGWSPRAPRRARAPTGRPRAGRASPTPCPI